MLVNTCDKKSEFVNYHSQFTPIYIVLLNFNSFDRKKEKTIKVSQIKGGFHLVDFIITEVENL